MTDGILTSIEKLRKSAARLNQITDQASATIREVEDFLNESCSVGVYAFVRVADLDPDGETGLFLEYRRVGGRYRIAVVYGGNDPEDETVKPWSDSTRDEKLSTVSKLPELIQEISKKLDESLERAQAATDAAKQVLAALTRKERA